jgi:nucleoside-diphosphate-sugar epimerase
MLAKKILITGATGFIGANITRALLRKGAGIHVLTRTASDKWRINDVLSQIADHRVDLLDNGALQKTVTAIAPDIIIHNAVYGGYPWQTDVARIQEINITGTRNLIEACKKNKFELFIKTGSSSEYGDKDEPMSEEESLNPVTEYGRSCAMSSSLCMETALKEKRRIITLRLFSPYGYFEDKTRLIPSVIISCLKGNNPKVASPEPVRDFIFIEDVMRFYISVIENRDKVEAEVFNVACGRQHSVAEVVEKIILLTGKNVRPEWGGVPNPRIEPKTWQADISKAHRLLHWRPRYDLDKGLKKTIDWFRDNLYLYE